MKKRPTLTAFREWLQAQPSRRCFTGGACKCPIATFLREEGIALKPLVGAGYYFDEGKDIEKSLGVWSEIFVPEWDRVRDRTPSLRLSAKRTLDILHKTAYRRA